MASTQIAAQMYTIREFCKTPKDTAASIEKLAKIGYGAVQASGLGPIEPKELKKVLDDNGIACIATHTDWGRIRSDLAGLIAELKTLACPYTAIGGMPGEFRSAEALPGFAKDMDQAGAAMRAEGIYLGYHNHSFEFEKYADTLCLDIFYGNSSRQNVFAEIDTYWVAHGGGDPAAWINKFAGAIPVVHFKDMGILQGKQVMLEIGEGNLNWPAILAACKDAGVEYYAVEQDNCNGRDPFESLAISLRNMQAMGLA